MRRTTLQRASPRGGPRHRVTTPVVSPMLAFAGTSGLAQGASASAAPSDHAHGGSQPGAAQIVTSIRTNSAAAHGNSSAFAFDDVGNHESPVRDVSPQQASLVLDPFD